MKRKCMLLALLLVLCCSAVLAENAVDYANFTYGGSGFDQLFEAAVAPDGRILFTGWTDSTDGTLQTRTKSGLSAWALCVDAAGRPLWNFCTRYGSTDTMHYPVFQQDGSVTMLMDSSHNGLYEVEWIHLDPQGQVLERKILVSKGTPYLICSYGIHDREPAGYVIAVFDKKKSTQQNLLYSFAGEFVQETLKSEAPYFPEARTADGHPVIIQNNDEPPCDVTVTFSVSSK